MISKVTPSTDGLTDHLACVRALNSVTVLCCHHGWFQQRFPDEQTMLQALITVALKKAKVIGSKKDVRTLQALIDHWTAEFQCGKLLWTKKTWKGRKRFPLKWEHGTVKHNESTGWSDSETDCELASHSFWQKKTFKSGFQWKSIKGWERKKW